MLDGQIDYSTYSTRELREAEQSIDRAQFPINAARLETEIRSRGQQSLTPMPWSGSPDIVAPKAAKSLRAGRAVWLFVAYNLVQLLVGFLGGMVATLYAGRALDHAPADEIRAFVSNVAIIPISLFCVLIAGAVIFRMVRKSFPGAIRQGALADIGWKRASMLQVATAAFTGAALAWVFTHLPLPVVPSAPQPEYGPLTTAGVSANTVAGFSWILVFWWLMLLAAAPVEEFLFRGAMLAGLARSFGKIFAGSLITVLFVAMHLFEIRFNLPAILAITALAVGTLIARLKTDTLIAPISLHAAYNLVMAIEAFP